MSPTPDDPTKAQAWISGEAPDQTVDFYIPRGNTGPMGPVGPIGPSLNVGDVLTVTGPAVPGTVGPQGLPGPKGDPGGISAAVELGTSDLNTIVAPGLYKQGTSSGANSPLTANYPYQGGYGVLMVTANGTDIVQTFYGQSYSGALDARIIYNRNRSNGVWSPWRIQRSSRMDQAAGRALYVWDDLNNREQLVYGDTGWRICSVINGWTGTLQMRRIGGVVYCTGSLDGVNYTTDHFLAPAVGFRPMDSSYVGTVSNGAQSHARSIGYAAGDLYVAQGAKTSYFMSFSYPTTDAWPTILPGSAFGSIPNT